MSTQENSDSITQDATLPNSTPDLSTHDATMPTPDMSTLDATSDRPRRKKRSGGKRQKIAIDNADRMASAAHDAGFPELQEHAERQAAFHRSHRLDSYRKDQTAIRVLKQAGLWTSPIKQLDPLPFPVVRPFVPEEFAVLENLFGEIQDNEHMGAASSTSSGTGSTSMPSS